MNPRNILVLFLFLSVAIESTVFAFPFIFVVSLILYILFPDTKTIVYTFIAGLLIDTLRTSIIGTTPITLLISFLILDLIKTRMLLNSHKTILLVLFASAFLYGNVFSYEDDLLIYVAVFGAAYLFIVYFYRKTTQQNRFGKSG